MMTSPSPLDYSSVLSDILIGVKHIDEGRVSSQKWMRLPKRLQKNPIIDAIAEVRFSSSIPNDAVIGLVYSKLQDTFGKPENLPVLQIPAALRENDPNLKYQPCYRFTKPGNVLLVGPHNVALSTYPYSDWGAASPLLNDVLSRLYDVRLFDRIERIGLRYVNFFENLNIFDHSTLVLKVRNTSIANQSVTLRTEASSNDFKVVTQASNRATAQVASVSKSGSILDLDITKENLNIAAEPLPSSLMNLFVSANRAADSAFFNVLADDFIATFGPEY
jgi:uncharacterized protein (TIGR04255 family)